MVSESGSTFFSKKMAPRIWPRRVRQQREFYAGDQGAWGCGRRKQEIGLERGDYCVTGVTHHQDRARDALDPVCSDSAAGSLCTIGQSVRLSGALPQRRFCACAKPSHRAPRLHAAISGLPRTVHGIYLRPISAGSGISTEDLQLHSIEPRL
jgi:hypothetical protein